MTNNKVCCTGSYSLMKRIAQPHDRGKKILMKPIVKTILLVSLLVSPMSYAIANCDERVKELRREIEQDKDKYTPAARREAQKELVLADAPSIQPLQCTEHINKARKALREGKK